MELNADFSQRTIMHAATLPWVSSPIAGIERRMLDRIGGEVARTTTIVRYARDSRFSPHVHGGGEEFLVLDGVFQDEHGDFPAGSYIRNPPQSRHTPGSAPGCTIFVKLWQFDPADRSHVRIDTGKMPYLRPVERPEIEVMPLFRDSSEYVRLERWPAASRVGLGLAGGGEFFVLDGAFEESGHVFVAQSWLRLPAGARLRAVAGPKGCLVWVKSGHLAQPRLAPAAAG
jgi:ChrR Cupin-like domain